VREVQPAVEASEAVRRVFWRHRWLLIFLILIPVIVVAPLRLTRPVTYAATANIQAQSAAPDADTQVLAILSRVTAVATSPQVVQRAINDISVDRNADYVARHEIAATSLSSSAVVAITVTDRSRAVAISLSRSLATAVVNFLNELGTQSSSQLATLTQQRNQLNGTRRTLFKDLARAQANHELSTDAGVEALLAELSGVEVQLSANLSAQQQILATSSANEGAGVISGPTYAASLSRHVAVDSILAALLGLIIGLLIATIRELARPTLAEPAAGARELSLVLLGAAQLKNEDLSALDDDLPARLDLAAHRLGARTLVLTGPVPPAALSALAAHLDGMLPAIADAPRDGALAARTRRVSGITALADHVSTAASESKCNGTDPQSHGSSGRDKSLTVTSLPDITLRARPRDPALVLVLSRFAPRAALDQAVDLGLTTGWPILGVIGLKQRGGRRRRKSGSKGKGVPVAVAQQAIVQAPAVTDSPHTDSEADEHLGSAI
jgi:hypothetical protein